MYQIFLFLQKILKLLLEKVNSDKRSQVNTVLLHYELIFWKFLLILILKF